MSNDRLHKCAHCGSNISRVYFVELRIVVDRPQFRDHTYRPAQPWEAHVHRLYKPSFKAATAFYEAVLEGDIDSSSDYVSEIALFSSTPDGNWCRVVRRRVYRVRDAGAKWPVKVADVRACSDREAQAKKAAGF